MIARRLFAIGVLLCLVGVGTTTLGCKKKEGGTSADTTATIVRKVTTMPAGTTPKFAFVTNNASDFWKLAAAGVKKYEGEAGITVDVKMPPSGKVAEQKQFLEDLVSQGYNGIAVSVIAPDAEVADINRAAEKTNVICHDSDAPKSNRLIYIGTNNYEAGKVLGGQILKILPDGGKIAVFVGQMSADNARERLKGIKDVLADKKYEVLAPKEDNKDPNKARSNVEDVINSVADVKLLVGLWSYNGPAIANALDASGKKESIKAAVFDEEAGTLDGIEKGLIACTVVQKPFQFGYLSSKMMHQLATKGADVLNDPLIKDGKVDTGVTVINNDATVEGGTKNVKEFRTELAELKK